MLLGSWTPSRTAALLLDWSKKAYGVREASIEAAPRACAATNPSREIDFSV